MKVKALAKQQNIRLVMSMVKYESVGMKIALECLLDVTLCVSFGYKFPLSSFFSSALLNCLLVDK